MVNDTSGIPVRVSQLSVAYTTVAYRAPWILYLIPTSLLYIAVCAALRFSRRDAMRKKFNYPDRASLSRMTNVEAQTIVQYLAELEFPRIYEMSVQFALFKTYGIPTISKLLVATREFSSPENASKRYADTGVLIQEFSAHHPQSDRVIKALARMNYIHSLYIKSGKISNNDLLYTLSVFITEPIGWVSRYEWREMSDMEICAIGTFWKSIGDAMGIRYKGKLARDKWRDGLEFYADIKMWAQEYEKIFMVPAESNMSKIQILTTHIRAEKTADELVPLLLFYVPKSLKATASSILGVLMGDRLRRSMGYQTPPKGYFQVVNGILETRRFLIRHLFLPRPQFLRVRQLSDSPDPTTGRYHMNNYLAHPYYNKPGILNRWGPEAWFVWLAGGEVPSSKGERYIPQGYKFEEVGPRALKNKGMNEMRALEEKLKIERPTGCPFAFAS